MKKWNDNFIYYRENRDKTVDYIDLSKIPRKVWGNKEVIDWKEVDNTVSFSYHGTHGTIHIKYVSQNSRSDYICRVAYGETEYLMTHDKIQYIKLGNVIKTKRIYKDKKNLYKPVSKQTLQNSPVFQSIVVDKNDLMYSLGSDKKILLKCPTCQHEDYYYISYVDRRGFNCKNCSVKTSYPEKFIKTFFTTHQVDFRSQYRVKYKDTSLIFDFYIPSHNLLVEVQGDQHYNINKFFHKKKSFGSSIFRDLLKLEYSKIKGCKIVYIDARKSDFNYLMTSLKSSWLRLLVDNIKVKEMEDNIMLYQSQIYRDIIQQYNNGVSVREISKQTNIERTKIKRFLVKADIYEPQPENNRPERKVICLNNGMIFKSLSEASRYAINASRSNIMKVCRGKRKHCGRDPITREKLSWKYYD